jgi:hypothetical protein
VGAVFTLLSATRHLAVVERRVRRRPARPVTGGLIVLSVGLYLGLRKDPPSG